jgi:hypothetical protein
MLICGIGRATLAKRVLPAYLESGKQPILILRSAAFDAVSFE